MMDIKMTNSHGRMDSIWRMFLSLLLLSILSHSVSAQKKVELKQAQKLRGATTAAGEQFQKLLGDVVLIQSETTIYCDSAYLFKNRNFVEAFGKVRITEGDSLTITGRR